MHLAGLGGYIDAQPTVVAACRQAKEEHWSPFSCAQYINHPPRGVCANVSVVVFKWIDVYNSQQQHPSNFSHSKSSSSSSSLLKFFNTFVPNQFGMGPWFVDHLKSQAEDSNGGIVHIEDLYQNDNVASLLKLNGVAFVANCDILNNNRSRSATNFNSEPLDSAESSELYLDYKLEKRYQPEWYFDPPP